MDCTKEALWIHLLSQPQLLPNLPIPVYVDNQSSIYTPSSKPSLPRPHQALRNSLPFFTWKRGNWRHWRHPHTYNWTTCRWAYQAPWSHQIWNLPLITQYHCFPLSAEPLGSCTTSFCWHHARGIVADVSWNYCLLPAWSIANWGST